MENGRFRAKLGIFVDDLSPSHLNWALIKSANELAKENVDICFFYASEVNPCLELEVASCPFIYAIGFEGILIATSLSTAAKLINFPANSKRIFYCWDLEWQRLSPNDKNYSNLFNVYRSKDLKLIARTLEQAKIISQTWNINVNNIVEEGNLTALLQIGLEDES